MTASRDILRAIREWPDVVAELAAECRRTAALAERLDALIAAEDDLHRATITRAQARGRQERPLSRFHTPSAGGRREEEMAHPRNNRAIPRGQRALGR